MSTVRLKVFNAYIANDLAFQGATRYAGVHLTFEQAIAALEDEIGRVTSYAPPIIAKPTTTGFTDQLWIRHNITGENGSGVIMEVNTTVSVEDLDGAAYLGSLELVAQEIINDEKNT